MIFLSSYASDAFCTHFCTNAEDIEQSASGNEIARKHSLDFSIGQAQLNTVLSRQIQEVFNECIAINSTAFEDTSGKT